MNPFAFPFIPTSPLPEQQNNQNIYQELQRLKYEIDNLKKRVEALERNPQNDYLEKEDGMHMI